MHSAEGNVPWQGGASCLGVGAFVLGQNLWGAIISSGATRKILIHRDRSSVRSHSVILESHVIVVEQSRCWVSALDHKRAKFSLQHLDSTSTYLNSPGLTQQLCTPDEESESSKTLQNLPL